jgi:uncharacterized protein (TIGR04255 family)
MKNLRQVHARNRATFGALFRMSLPSVNPALPDYANPPVVETVLGVQFDRLPGFTNAHLGAFWKTLDAGQWPAASDAPSLKPQFERFTEAARWARGLQLQLTPIPPGRVQITNRDGNRMIQVQNGRLHFNWLGSASDNYPRYETVRSGFAEALGKFTGFVAQADAGQFQPNQWEVTYINQIPHGTVWNTAADWTFFQPLRGVPTLEGVIEGEDFTGEWHFAIPGQRGRLHIEWQHALRTVADQPEQEIIQLTLTARGPLKPQEDKIQSILEGLDLGRETIVRAFAGLMSREANKQWGLKDAGD